MPRMPPPSQSVSARPTRLGPQSLTEREDPQRRARSHLSIYPIYPAIRGLCDDEEAVEGPMVESRR